MAFKITITRTEAVKKERDGEWVTLETRPLSKEEFEKSFLDNFRPRIDLGSEEKPNYAAELLKTGAAVKEVRGYAPKREVEEIVETKVFEQVVDEKDFSLTKVIQAANNLLQ